MGSTMNFASVSDGLAALIRAFEPCRTTGMVMTKKNVATLIDGLQNMHDEALHIETIADRAQWNARAKRDVLEAALAEGSVTILPVVPRATTRNGGQEGGAA